MTDFPDPDDTRAMTLCPFDDTESASIFPYVPSRAIPFFIICFSPFCHVAHTRVLLS